MSESKSQRRKRLWIEETQRFQRIVRRGVSSYEELSKEYDNLQAKRRGDKYEPPPKMRLVVVGVSDKNGDALMYEEFPERFTIRKWVRADNE